MAEGREVNLSLPYAGGLWTAPSGIKGRFARCRHPFLLALRAVRAAALDAAPDTIGGQLQGETVVRGARRPERPEA